MNLIRFIGLFLLVVTFFPAKISCQVGVPELETTTISILTCRSGDELYSTFGHTAIRINNPISELDVVYNYGVFSFNTPNFYPKFMRGKLPYYLAGTKTEYFLREYHYEKRSVFEQELILTNQQKKQIVDFLLENAKAENREYKYDFFFDNCATRIVDVYSSISEIKYTNNVEDKTFRQLLKENLQSLVWSDFGIDIVIGARADRLADRRGQMFLPEYVMENVSSALQNDTLPLVKEPHLVLDYEMLNAERKTKSTNWPLILGWVILAITVALNVLKLGFSTYFNKTILILTAIMSILLLFMWFGTDHKAVRDNWNVLWLNPLLWIYMSVKPKTKRIVLFILIALLTISALNCLIMVLPQFFNSAFLPLILTIGTALWFDFSAPTKRKPSV